MGLYKYLYIVYNNDESFYVAVNELSFDRAVKFAMDDGLDAMRIDFLGVVNVEDGVDES